jgi:hypothetical protein
MKKQKLLSRAVVLAFLLVTLPSIAAPSMGQPSPTLRDRARESGGKPLELRGVSMRSGPPKSIEALTVEADVVLLARLSRGKSYLSPNEYHLYTDFIIHEPRVISGSLVVPSAAPTAGTPQVITLLGGEMVIEGVPVRYLNDNYSAIVDGEYLLFLERDQDAGRFQIYERGIFRIDGQLVKPLAREADDEFPGLRNAAVPTVISRIEGAAKQR